METEPNRFFFPVPDGTPALRFSAIDSCTGIEHAFLCRSPEVDVQVDRELALQRLDATHQSLIRKLGWKDRQLAKAEQVHGAGIAKVDSLLPGEPFPGVDGLITNHSDVCLAIYVADCAPVYLIDRKHPAIGLVHSGKKGTELGIVPRAIEKMQETFGTRAENLLVVVGPCIRPPHYEVDIAAEIVRQARSCGVDKVVDCGLCTAADPVRFYSYRREKGKTGRMLALLSLAS